MAWICIIAFELFYNVSVFVQFQIEWLVQELATNKTDGDDDAVDEMDGFQTVALIDAA